MTINEIRRDLYDIRYYYAHESFFEKSGLRIARNVIEEKQKGITRLFNRRSLVYMRYILLCIRKTILKLSLRKIGTYRKDI